MFQKTSQNIQFNATNVIHAFAYIAFYFNGDYLDSARTAANVFLYLSENMNKNRVFDSYENAVQSVMQNAEKVIYQRFLT